MSKAEYAEELDRLLRKGKAVAVHGYEFEEIVPGRGLPFRLVRMVLECQHRTTLQQFRLNPNTAVFLSPEVIDKARLEIEAGFNLNRKCSCIVLWEGEERNPYTYAPIREHYRKAG